jgi:hypothetical protein
MGLIQCFGLPSGLPGAPICGVSGSYRAVPISVSAGQRNAYPQPSSWAMALVPAVPYTPPKTQALPPARALSSLGALPHQWRVSMRCVLHIPGGCVRYIGHVTLRGSACGDMALLVRTLVRSGFSIAQDFHYQVATGARCGVGASRKLQPGGGDWFIVGGSLEDQPGNTAKGGFFISAM